MWERTQTRLKTVKIWYRNCLICRVLSMEACSGLHSLKVTRQKLPHKLFNSQYGWKKLLKISHFKMISNKHCKESSDFKCLIKVTETCIKLNCSHRPWSRIPRLCLPLNRLLCKHNPIWAEWLTSHNFPNSLTSTCRVSWTPTGTCRVVADNYRLYHLLNMNLAEARLEKIASTISSFKMKLEPNRWFWTHCKRV